MNQWENRVAVVTGACSSIGSTIIQDLLKYNLIVVGLDRKLDLLEKLKTTLPPNLQKRFHCLKVDWQIENDILKAFDWIEKSLGGCDILINNTVVFHQGQLATMETKLIREYLDINVITPILCNREAIRSMRQRNIAGQLIMINDMDGHRISNMMETGISSNIWAPTKYCLTAMNEVLRQELYEMGTRIKITNISPSLVDKEIITENYNNVAKQLVLLKPEKVSQAVLYVLGTSQDVLVNDVMLRGM